MKRLLIALLTWAFVFGTAVVAQVQPTDPAASTDPLQPVEVPPIVTQVRVINLSPNAQSVSLELRRAAQEQEALSLEGLLELAYTDTTEYQELEAGQYHVTVIADGVPAFEDTITMQAKNYHTIAIVGLLLPEETEAEEESGGFLAWLSGLLTGENAAGKDTLELRLLHIRDELFADVESDQRSVRIVHAAPGTAPIDLAVLGERGRIVSDVAFGNASGYQTVDETVGDLELRVTGSRARLLDLNEADLESGRITTVFVTGTPVEEVPLEIVVLTDAPRRLPEPQPLPGLGAPAAPTPAQPEAPPNEQG